MKVLLKSLNMTLNQNVSLLFKPFVISVEN